MSVNETSITQIREDFLKQLATPMVAESLFAKVPDIVFCMKNAEAQYVSANPAFAQRLGLRSVNEILGKRAEDIFPPHLAETYQAQDEIVLKQGREISDRLELVFNRDGSLGWYLASKIPLMGKNNTVIGLASISRDLLMPGEKDLQISGLARVIETIQRDFSEALKPSELAQSAGISLAQLERRMRKIFKLSASQFIRKTRIEAAANMLTGSEKPIVDIAMDCGYGDQSAFSRQFKATVGMAPGAYRSTYQ